MKQTLLSANMCRGERSAHANSVQSEFSVLVIRNQKPRQGGTAFKVASFIIFSLLYAILSLSFVSASVDLLNPTHQITTNQTSLAFEYYAGMENVSACTLFVDNNPFMDFDAQPHSINSVSIQGILPGTYAWNVSCSNDTTTEVSTTRTITIDTQAPTLVIFTPNNGTTAKTIPLDIITNDETATIMTCSIFWNTNQNSQLLEIASVARNTHYAKNYIGNPSQGTLTINCNDNAGNTVTQTRTMNLLPDYGLILSLDKTEYGLNEPPRLTIDTIDGANVTVDVCPDQTGFVQCTSALLASNDYPQTITLVTMNKTGPYFVEGIATFGNQSKVNRTHYTVVNSIVISLSSNNPVFNRTTYIDASISGGVPPYRVSWILANGTVITDSANIQLTYTTPGTFTHKAIVIDAANNIGQVNITHTIAPLNTIIFNVVDNDTNAPLQDVELDITNIRGGETTNARTLTNGLAYLDLEPSTYRIFASKQGYEYHLEEYALNETTTIRIPLGRSNAAAPSVILIHPSSDAIIITPASIRFTVQHTTPKVKIIEEPDGTKRATPEYQQVGHSLLQRQQRQKNSNTHHLKRSCDSKKQ